MSVKVRERKKGSGEWWIFIDHNGVRKAKKIGPKNEADRLATIVAGRLASGDLGVLEAKREIKSFKEYAEIWISTTVPATLKASTQDDYRYILGKHLKTSPFYRKPVDEITKGDVKRFLRSKLKDYAPSTVTHIKNAIGGIFNEAIDDEIISANPSHGIKLGTKKDDSRKPKIEPLEVDEVNKLLSTCQEKRPEFRPLMSILVTTGMRIGEASALQWQDVDFEDRTILVRRNYVRNRIEDSTKNGKERRVDMTEQLTAELRQMKRERAEAALKAGKGSIDHDWLFPSIKDKSIPLNYRTWRRDIFYPVLNAADIRRIRVHDLRHTYASIMISTGCNLVYLRDQLGHSSIKVTADVYGHLLRGKKEKPVDALDGILQPSATYTQPDPAKTKKAPAKRVASA